MINEEKLGKLYDGILEGKDLTTKQMTEYGFSSKDLKELVDNGKIERLKKGLYTLKDVNDMFYYGKKMIADRKSLKATMIFEKCFMLDKNHLGSCFQLFLRSIQNENYEKAFELYDYLTQTSNEFYKVDMNYYLYLLSIITEVPEKYREYVKNLKVSDLKISDLDKRYDDIYLQNKIRMYAFEKKLSYAVTSFKDLLKKHNKLTVQDIIIKNLLFQAKNKETISKNTINSLIKEKKYNDAYNYLLNKKTRQNLSVIEDYTLKLIQTFIEINETKIIPQNKSLKVRTFFAAIDSCDYVEALKMNNEYNENYNIDNKNNALNLILNDICNLIDNLLKEEEIKREEKRKNEELKQKEEKINKQVKSEINENNKEISSFSSVISFLMKNDLDNAFISLNQYMKTINKTEYEFLIINLIKLSLLEQDLAFTKPMLTLTLMSKDLYSFDASTYMQEFYIALSQNKLKEAKIYLDIVSMSEKLKKNDIVTDKLYQVLELKGKEINDRSNNPILIKEEKPENNFSKEVKIEKKVVENGKIIQNKEKFSLKRAKIVPQNNEKRDIERKFLAEKHAELMENKGIILLKPMDNARIENILSICKEYSDMVVSVIGEENKKQIVLRYYNVGFLDVDVKTFIHLANQEYTEGKYEECIKKYLDLLSIFNNPRSINYSKLGLSYMRTGKISKAIDYLTVANAVSKQEGTDFDFSDIILRLKGNTSKGEIKPRFEMKQTEFNYNDVNDYYGIENFEEINEKIIASKLDVISVCEQIGLSKEQIDIILLIYARELYAQGNISKGDLFLKTFEKSKNKTKTTIRLSEEIRKNKMFYQNRKEIKFKQLALIPKKK